jgi:hypothetical protein
VPYGGDSWEKLIAFPWGDVRSVAITPGQPDVVYAGTQGGGVFVTPDGGTTWASLLAGMEANDDIWALEIDPVQPEVVWAGSNRTGVYRWDPDNDLWVHVNAGLRTRAVTDLAISSDGQALYATT